MSDEGLEIIVIKCLECKAEFQIDAEALATSGPEFCPKCLKPFNFIVEE